MGTIQDGIAGNIADFGAELEGYLVPLSLREQGYWLE